MRYKTCPLCGAHLDPGERCDCNKKTAVSAANADNGGAGNGMDSQNPAYMITEKHGGFKHENE